ncbi:MAG: DUF4842 domain-containing protein [Bacteroidaceae bacterium]|nr:DUF4842 domain-containing protein [Bacteroidaceae bacterium]
MKKYWGKSFAILGLLGLMSASCTKTEDLYDPDWVIKKYKMNWEQQFGAVDENQTWNTVSSRIVNVTVAYPGDFVIKIYTANPRDSKDETYLLGQYQAMGGEKIYSLKVDMPSCLQYVYVSLVDKAGGRVIKSAKLVDGIAEVAFGTSQTKAATSRTTDSEEYLEFEPAVLEALNAALPENEDADNKTGLLNNYEFVSNGTFTLSPIYGKTSANLELGYYYYNPQTQTVAEKTDVVLIEDLSVAGIAQTFNPQAGNWVYDPNTGTSSPTGAWENYNYQYIGSEWTNWGHTKIRAKAYTINVPQGYRVGFYLKNLSGNYPKLYSNVALNEDGYYYSATVNQNGNLFVGMEDWIREESNGVADCNDVVFSVDAASAAELPDPVDPDTPSGEETTMEYIIACEDLGATDDFDFNDVVFSVSHVSGSTTATVKMLAAGGTLPVYIKYGTMNLGEIHDLLGVSSHVMVNTGNGTTANVTSQEIEVPADFSMSTDMGGFSITVVKGGDEEVTVDIAAPGKGEAPQMICVASSTWVWPTERTSIVDAYPDFGDWGQNYASNQTWYLNPSSENGYSK